jgi:cysteine desulfurase family protein
MVYLDNAATSYPKPPEVHEAAARFLQTLGANPGRGGHRMAVGASRAMEEARLALARFVNAGDTPERVVFTLNCTDALNLGIKGFVRGVRRREAGVPHVVTSHAEHNSVSRPLEQLARDGLVTLTRVALDASGWIDPDEVGRAIRAETRLVALTHGSNVTGAVQPIEAIGRVVRERGDGRVALLVDAAQTIGVEPVDVQRACVDLLAFPGHKALYGYPGTGALYVGPRVDVQPWREGGTGGDSKHPVQPDEYPHRLEGGTHNTVGIASMRAGLAFVERSGRDAIRRHELALADRLLAGLADLPKVTVHGPRGLDGRVATVSFGVMGYASQDVGAILDSSFDIAVRAGLHCAPYCHQQLGTYPDGTVRASIGAFNTAEDVDALLDAVRQIALA